MFRFNPKFIAALLLSVGCLTPGLAQTRISLQECIQQAIRENLQIKDAELQQESTINTYQQSRRDRMPAVSGVFNPGYSLGRSIDPYTNSITTDHLGTNSLGITASWAIYNGNQLQNLQKQNALNLSAGQYDLQAAKNMITLKVLQAYLQVLVTQELLQVALKQAEATQLQLDRMTRQVQLQVVAEANLYNLQSQRANDDLQITNARNEVRTAQMALSQLLNWPADQNYELEAIAREVTAAPVESWQQVYRSSLTILPESKSAALRIQSARKGMEAARGLRMPTLSLNSSLGTSYSSAAKKYVTGDSYREEPLNAFVTVNNERYQLSSISQATSTQNMGYLEQLGNNPVWSVSLSLRIPIFNANQASYRIQEAKIQQLRADNQQKQVHLQMRQQIEQAFVLYRNALERQQTHQRQVEVLEKTVHAAQVRLEVGVVNVLDYTLAKTNLDRARASLIQATYECAFRQQIIGFYQSGTLN